MVLIRRRQRKLMKTRNLHARKLSTVVLDPGLLRWIQHADDLTNDRDLITLEFFADTS